MLRSKDLNPNKDPELEKTLRRIRKERRENPIAWKYRHHEFDERAMKLPLNDDTYRYLLPHLIYEIWLQEWWRRNLTTDEHHRQYIDTYRTRYRCPDFLELVGPPQPEHYDEDGNLTIWRKATLLLMGVFEWRGLRIGKHQAVFGFNVWRQPRRYTPDKKGWYVAVKKIRPGPKEPIVADFFRPLRNYRCIRLEEFLAPHEKYTLLTFKDGNQYNCHRDNLEIIPTRGRPMTCWFCGHEVTAKASKRFKWDRGTIRACFDCLMYGNVPLAWKKPIL